MDITEAQREAEKLLWRNIARRKEFRPDDLVKLRKAICSRCDYSLENSGAPICDYYLTTGRLRPCIVADCRKMGIFKPKSPRGGTPIKVKQAHEEAMGSFDGILTRGG